MAELTSRLTGISVTVDDESARQLLATGLYSGSVSEPDDEDEDDVLGTSQDDDLDEDDEDEE